MNIAILTGGGDCPGMNTFIRAVTRCTLNLEPGSTVWGVSDGWRGLVHNQFRELAHADVAGILDKGGTILGTMRLPEFKYHVQLRYDAAQHLHDREIDYLFMQGGNGSLRASQALAEVIAERGYRTRILAASGSIDNDVVNNVGPSIGFYSAIEKSVEMLSWLRDTADSHRRVFIIGSMGAKSAYLAFYSGVASGCEYVIRPDENVDFEALADMIVRRERDTRIIVSEAYANSLEEIRKILEDLLAKRGAEHKIRTVDMGYFQRGGKADVQDLLCASWIAYRMVAAARQGAENAYYTARFLGDDLPPVPLAIAADSDRSCHTAIPEAIIDMARALR